mmetsp:Transcript_2007/g.7186  ORF Transcript_2007/g.7186 Transcript_2007/m.7186 type:complete len:216 (+) Transcript_2007:2090-2737(+)
MTPECCSASSFGRTDCRTSTASCSLPFCSCNEATVATTPSREASCGSPTRSAAARLCSPAARASCALNSCVVASSFPAVPSSPSTSIMPLSLSSSACTTPDRKVSAASGPAPFFSLSMRDPSTHAADKELAQCFLKLLRDVRHRSCLLECRYRRHMFSHRACCCLPFSFCSTELLSCISPPSALSRIFSKRFSESKSSRAPRAATRLFVPTAMEA